MLYFAEMLYSSLSPHLDFLRHSSVCLFLQYEIYRRKTRAPPLNLEGRKKQVLLSWQTLAEGQGASIYTMSGQAKGVFVYCFPFSGTDGSGNQACLVNLLACLKSWLSCCKLVLSDSSLSSNLSHFRLTISFFKQCEQLAHSEQIV